MDAQPARVERVVNSQAIANAYPNIDTEPYAVLGSQRIDKSQKKRGEAAKCGCKFTSGRLPAREV